MVCEKCNPIHLFFEDGVQVCSKCGNCDGNTRRFVTSINAWNDPLQICFYQRKKRFEQIMLKIVWPTIENKDVPVYKLLSGKRYNSAQHVMRTLKKLKVKDKRYHSIHAFCKYFQRDYIPPTLFTLQNKKNALCVFRNVEEMFLKHKSDVPFFSYAWLIRKILNLLDLHEFDLYIKKIRCPKRNLYYEEMFNDLYTLIVTRDGVENCPLQAGGALGRLWKHRAPKMISPPLQSTCLPKICANDACVGHTQ